MCPLSTYVAQVTEGVHPQHPLLGAFPLLLLCVELLLPHVLLAVPLVLLPRPPVHVLVLLRVPPLLLLLLLLLLP